MPERAIAHLDMDAFYASVELLRRPELRGRPVAIGGRGDPTRRGVVTTATYEARAFGIRSAMPLRRAAELCPACIFLPVDFDEYRRMSRRFKAAIAAEVDRIEDRGIDEVYLDLTEPAHGDLGAAEAIAQRVKRRVHEATGLTCSIGVAPNKLLAKIASDLEKPDALVVIRPADIATRIWPLPARRINGIGPKAEARLHALGIATIGELAAADPQMLLARFGEHYGRWLHEVAHGRDERPVVTYSEPKSLSRETTFEHDLHPRADWHAIAALLADMSRRVAADAQRKRYLARRIGVKVRFDDFRTVTREVTVREPTCDAATIRKAAFECLARVAPERRLRLLGVRLTTLVPEDEPLATVATSVAAAGALPGAVPAARAPAEPAERRDPATDPTLPLF